MNHNGVHYAMVSRHRDYYRDALRNERKSTVRWMLLAAAMAFVAGCGVGATLL